MYRLELIVDPPETDNWGDFQLRKTFRVTKNNETTGVFGYVVQKIEKTTRVDVEGKTLTRTTEIQEFTSSQVLYATHNYYEVFPILNGNPCDGEPQEDRGNCIDDQFQNGPLLRYLPRKTRRGVIYEADDEPPTEGSIRMVGTNVFIPTDEATARSIYTAIQTGQTSIRLQDTEWTLSPETPANGLPYRDEFTLPKGPKTIHNVTVTWNNQGNTQITSKLIQLAGSIRGRAASKSYRKRRTGRATRRLRGLT
jgi:hypothetical protein